MIYFSLVGTQIMAVLNPLLALTERYQKPDRIALAATSFEKSITHAETIKGFLMADGYPDDSITVSLISESLKPDSANNPPVQSLVKRLWESNETVVFNLAGGMNFQIAACLSVMSPTEIENCLFLYPETEGIHTVTLKNGAVASHDRLPLPKPVDVLKLQQVEYQELGGKFSPFLDSLFKTCGIRNLPIVQKNIRIKNVTFDAVLNNGNELIFLKLLPSSNYLKEVRDVIRFRREDAGELYHRNLIVLTNNADAAERIEAESGGKTDVILYSPQQIKSFANLLVTRILRGYPSSRQTGVAQLSQDTGQPAPSKNSALYVALGQNIMPTLTAVWSHKPAEVCFLYTPDDPVIVRYKEAILRNKNLLPASRIRFYPVSITGAEILDIPKPADQDAEVNITPGTKGHTTFLSLWARLHGAPIYSIKTDEQKVYQIPEGNTLNANAPCSVTYLKLSGVKVKAYGESKGSVLQKKDEIQTLLRCIRQIGQAGMLTDFPVKTIELDKVSFVPGNNETAQIQFKGEQPVTCTIDQSSVWFERVVGFVMAECGATDVQIRIRTAWDPNTEKRIQKQVQGKVPINPHMSDIDVAARFGTDYYVISCKATDKKAPGPTAAEADFFAYLFGRFAVPMVCFLKYPEKPYKLNGVYIFGYPTLTDTQAMKELLLTAVDERRKKNR